LTLSGCVLSAETGPLRPPGPDASDDAAAKADADSAVDAGACGCATGRRSTELASCCAPASACPEGYTRATHTDCDGQRFDVCVDVYSPACL
jgi:hypothetical protein